MRVYIALAAAALFFAPAADARVTLFHNSFSTAYRSPGGAVATGTPVTLRLRVTGARPKAVAVRLETTRVSLLRMRRAGSVWSAIYRAPAAPTIVNYAFRVTIGRRTLESGELEVQIRRGREARSLSLEGAGEAVAGLWREIP